MDQAVAQVKLPFKHVPQVYRDKDGEVIAVLYSAEVRYPRLEYGKLWRRW